MFFLYNAERCLHSRHLPVLLVFIWEIYKEWFSNIHYKNIDCKKSMAQRPLMGKDIPTIKASQSTPPHHTQYHSSGRVIRPMNVPLPDYTQQSQGQTSTNPAWFEHEIPTSEWSQTHTSQTVQLPASAQASIKVITCSYPTHLWNTCGFENTKTHYVHIPTVHLVWHIPMYKIRGVKL